MYTIFIGYLIVLVLIGLGSLASYIIKGLGLYGMALRAGHPNPWFAWLPYVREYLLGQLCGSITFKKRTLKHPGVWLIVLPIISAVLAYITSIIFMFAVFALHPNIYNSLIFMDYSVIEFFLFFLLVYTFASPLLLGVGILYGLLRDLVYFRIFKQYTTVNMSIVHAVLTRTVPLYGAICFFRLNKQGPNQHNIT